MGKNMSKHGGGMGYGRFAAMILTSTVVMFGLMYLNTYLLSHVFWSETRVYMALLMGATMAIIMLAFMLSMYTSKTVNAAIFVGAAVVFGVSLWLVRSQVTVGDTSYMRAMIPHHSIAIMTSSRADISDPRVRKLADEIIYAQDKEIAEMRYLVADIDANGDAQAEPQPAPARIVSVEEALATPDLAVLDPGFMTEDEVAQLFPEGPACTFTYTDGSAPVVAVGTNGAALVKLSADLIRLEGSEEAAAAPGLVLAADSLNLRIAAVDGEQLGEDTGERREAILLMNLQGSQTVGYRGLYGCGA